MAALSSVTRMGKILNVDYYILRRKKVFMYRTF